MLDKLHCAKCGVPLVGASQFCSSCGTPCPPQQSAANTVPRNIHAFAVRVSTACVHCAEPVPVNGPVERVHCPHCEKDMPTPPGLANGIVEGNKGTLILAGLGQAFKVEASSDPNPECPKCGNSIPFEAHRDAIGKTTTLACPGCGATIPTYPAPEWFKQQFPTALQVFGGDADTAKAAGLDLHVNETKPAPIAIACPKCGGGLTITSDTARTVECTYCKASVFLPDALWKRLHPVKTMLRWTLTESPKKHVQSESGGDAESSPQITFHMRVLRDGHALRMQFSQDSVKIGSAADCTLRITDDPKVSRIHAVIETSPDAVSLVDLGSASGTFLNGNKITKAELHSGDTITLGHTRINVTFKGPARHASGSAAEPSAPPAPATQTPDPEPSRPERSKAGSPIATGRLWAATKKKLAFPVFMLVGMSLFLGIIFGPSVAPPFLTNWHIERVVRRELAKANASTSDAELLEHINQDLKAEGVSRYSCDGSNAKTTPDFQLTPATVTFTRTGARISAEVKYTQEVHDSSQADCSDYRFHFRESAP